MIRDLVEIAVTWFAKESGGSENRAELNAEERLLDLLLPPRRRAPAATPGPVVWMQLTPRPARRATTAPGKSCGNSSGKAS